MPRSKLTWNKQKQNETQLGKLQGQAASAAVLAFHEECDRHSTSRACTVTPCKMLSSKNGRSEVVFANGGASVCSAQLLWRQAPAAVRRSEQQSREQRTRTQAEAADTVRKHEERQRYFNALEEAQVSNNIVPFMNYIQCILDRDAVVVASS